MSAVFSECGTYRYALWREVGAQGDLLAGAVDKGTCLFVMLNPSTADAVQNDPTIRRCIGFARRWGYGRLAVGNLYALRSTDPAALLATFDPIGPDNDAQLVELADAADLVVAAWGSFPNEGRAADVLRLLGPEVHCLGTTQSGSPRHPLYVRGETEPSRFEPEVLA